MKKFSDYIKEQLEKRSKSYVIEMANLSGTNTGLDDVFIWLGDCSMKRGYRIKVSNIPNKSGRMSKSDSFSIYYPDFKTIGKINTKHITKRKLDKIVEFMKVNEQAIKNVLDSKIDTVEFLKQMKTV